MLPNVDVLIASAHDLSGLLALGDDMVVAALHQAAVAGTDYVKLSRP